MKEDKTEVNNPENLKNRIKWKKSQSFLQVKETVFT